MAPKNLYYVKNKTLGVGKTYLLAKFCLIKSLIDGVDAQNISVIAPSLRQSKIVIDYLVRMLVGMDVAFTTINNSCDKYGVSFSNQEGVAITIHAIPISQREYAGRTVVLDEFNSLPVEIIKDLHEEYVFNNVDGLNLKLKLTELVS